MEKHALGMESKLFLSLKFNLWICAEISVWWDWALRLPVSVPQNDSRPDSEWFETGTKNIGWVEQKKITYCDSLSSCRMTRIVGVQFCVLFGFREAINRTSQVLEERVKFYSRCYTKISWSFWRFPVCPQSQHETSWWSRCWWLHCTAITLVFLHYHAITIGFPPDSDVCTEDKAKSPGRPRTGSPVAQVQDAQVGETCEFAVNTVPLHSFGALLGTQQASCVCGAQIEWIAWIKGSKGTERGREGKSSSKPCICSSGLEISWKNSASRQGGRKLNRLEHNI